MIRTVLQPPSPFVVTVLLLLTLQTAFSAEDAATIPSKETWVATCSDCIDDRHTASQAIDADPKTRVDRSAG